VNMERNSKSGVCSFPSSLPNSGIVVYLSLHPRTSG